MKVLSSAVVLSLLLASAPVRGQEAAHTIPQPNASEVEVSNALVCDTRQQVERIVSLMRGDLQAPSTPSTRRSTADRLRHARLAFVRGALATMRTKEETFQIVGSWWSAWSPKPACRRRPQRQVSWSRSESRAELEHSGKWTPVFRPKMRQ